MLGTGMKPRDLALISLLSAGSSMGTTKLGEQIHALILKHGLNSCLCVCNALITMYFKCGSLDGFSVFEDMPVRDTVSWNAVLTGCAQNGRGKKAISVFEQMEAAGIFPDEISFLGDIGVCSNAGLVDKARAYFNCMSQNYGITPRTHNYTCMVDLLGKGGELYEAQTLTDSMP